MQEEWTEKYRPKSLADVVGNDLAIRTLKRWADSWQKGTPRLKAVVLRGEPGTGKTSSALALANDMGWDHIEMNASDQRNAASIKSVAGAGSANQTFSASGEFLASSAGRRKLIVIDEADNLFGREDYGGAKAIVETIRESGQPIVLIVNDYYELTRKAPAVKGLVEKAVFKRLSRQDVASVLKSVLDREGVAASSKVIDRIAENAEGDLRAAINDLQMIVEGKSELNVDDSDALGKRNQEKELGTALHSMFRARSAREARDATFDLDSTPDELLLWIEENVPLEMRGHDELASAFDAVSKADVYLGRTRALQHYGLWSYAKEMMTGGVALSRERPAGTESPEYRFPGHLIVMSRARGPRASRDSLAKKLAVYYHTSSKCIKDSTLPLLSMLLDNDEELLLELGKRLDLDDSDVGYLLGVEPSSNRVAKLVARMRQDRTGEESDSGSRRGPKTASAKKGIGRF